MKRSISPLGVTAAKELPAPSLAIVLPGGLGFLVPRSAPWGLMSSVVSSTTRWAAVLLAAIWLAPTLRELLSSFAAGAWGPIRGHVRPLESLLCRVLLLG